MNPAEMAVLSGLRQKNGLGTLGLKRCKNELGLYYSHTLMM